MKRVGEAATQAPGAGVPQASDGSLGITGNSLTPPYTEQRSRQIGRSARAAAKAVQRRLTETVSSRHCWSAIASNVNVEVGGQLVAHVSGIARCGSPWSCPMCAPVVRQRRAEEIETGMTQHLHTGGSAVLVTFTTRHHRGDPLADRLGVVAQALRHVLKGSGWTRRRDRLGYVGSIKATEITWGEKNGWHPHAHVLLLFKRELTDEERDDLELWLWGRWSKIVEDRGLGTINGHGVDVRPVRKVEDLGAYLTKVEGGWSIGHELARFDRKRSAPMQLLERLVETGESRWANLWQEYEQATYGRLAIQWSRGLRAHLLGSEESITDQEAAASEGLDLTLVRAWIERVAWNRAVREGEQGQVLEVIEERAALVIGLAVLSGHEPVPLALRDLKQPMGGAGAPDGAAERPARRTGPPADVTGAVYHRNGTARGTG